MSFINVTEHIYVECEQKLLLESALLILSLNPNPTHTLFKSLNSVNQLILTLFIAYTTPLMGTQPPGLF